MTVFITAVCLLCATISIMPGSASEESCRNLDFLLIQMGKRLKGHVFNSASVAKIDDCTIWCYLEKNCMSYNLGPQENDQYACELSDSDHNLHPEDLVPREGYSYRNTKNACASSPCPTSTRCLNGFGDRGFVCQCPQGYELEENCQEAVCQQVANCNALKAQLQSNVETFEEERKQLEVENVDLQKDVDTLEGENEQLERKNADLLENVVILEGEKKKLEGKNADLQNNVETLENENEQLKEKLKETIYILAEPAENCNDRCGKQGMKCVKQGAFPGGVASEKFEQLGFTCKKTSSYIYADQPCYAPSSEHCHGSTGIPEDIKCEVGNNSHVRRLCPCAKA